ncbi:hypothetical protein Cgig2_007637 [Carnegiea gigantea]|uniref:Uncharacterized protein n=1 Tax=Carnegiea gigantea TaxID=171969 RepID=A0A9Q1JVT6_9CARY|nr:hypothetical protein Cgig2_007637 [Carnegiea gigantea]
MEVVNWVRPPHHFHHIPTNGCESSHRQDWVPSLRYTEREREVSLLDRSGWPYTEQQGRRTAVRPSGRPTQRATAKSTTVSTPYATHSRHTAWLKEQRPDQSISKERTPVPSTRIGARTTQPRDEKCSTEVVATIAGGHTEAMTRDEEGRRKTRKEEEGARKRRGHIRLSTILMTLLLRSKGLSIQGVSCLIPYTLTLTRSRNKFHLLGVSALVLGPLAFIYVVEGGLEIDILLKFLRQRHQDLAQIPHGVGTTLLIALLLGLSHPFSPHGRFSLGLCNPSSLRRYDAALTPRANASAIATSSSEILGESEVLKDIKFQDLTKSLTSENLAAGSALMKLVDGHFALGGEPPTA